jgi:hypothetical protein
LRQNVVHPEGGVVQVVLLHAGAGGITSQLFPEADSMKNYRKSAVFWGRFDENVLTRKKA